MSNNHLIINPKTLVGTLFSIEIKKVNCQNNHCKSFDSILTHRIKYYLLNLKMHSVLI